MSVQSASSASQSAEQQPSQPPKDPWAQEIRAAMKAIKANSNFTDLAARVRSNPSLTAATVEAMKQEAEFLRAAIIAANEKYPLN